MAFLAIILFTPFFVSARNVNITGRIADASSLQPLQGASVYFTDRISIARDTSLGTLRMVQDNTLLPEASVYARRHDFGVRNSQMSAIEVPVADIKGMPSLFGEIDVMKALQRLPGVQSVKDGNAGIYVRGGNYDQNLIMLDGSTLEPKNIIYLFDYQIVRSILYVI